MKLRGLPMPGGTNLQLLLTGPRPVPFSMATRAAEPIAGLPLTKAAYVFTRVVGGWSVHPYPAGPRCVPDCAGRPLPNYFLADGSLTPTRIGPRCAVSASDHRGAVWLATFRRSTDHIDTVPASAQLVSTDGRPIGPKHRLPAGYLIERAVGSYLLLAAMSQPGTPTYQLWDPRTRRTVRGFDNVIAAGPEQIAWIQACANCPVHLLNVSTGKSATIPVPQRTWAYNGTFSSDGRFLAVQLSAGVTSDGRATEERIGVIDITSQHLIVIPGSTVSVDKNLSFGWQASSHRLIAVLPKSGGSIQVAYWQPGDAHLLVATTHIPRQVEVDDQVGPRRDRGLAEQPIQWLQETDAGHLLQGVGVRGQGRPAGGSAGGSCTGLRPLLGVVGHEQPGWGAGEPGVQYGHG